MRHPGRRAALALAAATVACPPALRAAEPEPVVLQLGAMPIEGAAEAYYAAEMGFFRAAGLDVKLTVLNSGSAIVAAMMSGALDIGFGSPPPLILARQRSLPVKYVAFAPLYTGPRPQSAVMVAKDAPIRTAADLNGKIVAVAALHDVGQYQVQAWIDKNGGNASTVQWVEIPYVQMGAALEAGRIAAAGNTEPYITGAKSVARIIGNMNDAVAPHYLMAGWFATESWLAKNPETARRFAAAIAQTAKWANAHHKETAPLLVRYAKITPEVAADMARAVFDESERPDPRLIQPVIDLMQHYGKLTPFNASDLLWAPPAAAGGTR